MLHTLCVNKLIDARANVELVDNNGKSAFIWACECSNASMHLPKLKRKYTTDIIRALFNAGVNPNTNYGGMTALEIVQNHENNLCAKIIKRRLKYLKCLNDAQSANNYVIQWCRLVTRLIKQIKINHINTAKNMKETELQRSVRVSANAAKRNKLPKPYTTAGPSHRSNKSVFFIDSVVSIDDAKREAQKIISIEAMHEHQDQLKKAQEKEEACKAERLKYIEIGNAIAEGERSTKKIY